VSALFDGTFTNQPNLTTGSTTQGIWLTSGASQNVTIGASSAQTLALTGNAMLNGISNAGIYMNDTTNNRNLTVGSNVTVALVNNTAFYNSQSSGALTFNGVFNINGNKALTVGSANATGNVVFNGGINNLQTSNFIASGGNVTVNGALAGTATTTGGFRLTAGTLTMNLTNTGHTFHITSGTTNGNTGTLRIASANTLNGTGNFTFGDGTVLNTSGSAITSGMTALFSTANSNRDIFFGQAGDTSANNLTFTGAGASTVDFTGSIITINGSGVTISTNTTWTNANTSARTFTVNGAGNTFVLAGLGLGATGDATSRAQTFTGTGNLLITGAVTNGNASSDQGIIKTGNGTLTLAGSNTYTGATAINAGVLNLQNADGLGTAAVGTTVASGAALQLEGGISVGGEALTLSGNGVSSAGAMRNIWGNNSYSGNITLNAATRINSDADLLILSGNIGGTQNLTLGGAGNTTISGVVGTSTGTLTKDGAGTLALSRNNTYTGTTTINAGSLRIGHANALGTSGNITFGGGALQYGSGITTDLSSRLKNSGTAILVDTNSNNVTFASVVDSSNSGGLTKNGSGTLTLSGNNTYTGTTTVNSGTLTGAAAGALGESTVINVSGGSFLVTAENAVNDNAVINLNGGRMAVSGTFNETVGALTLSANSTLDFAGFVGTLRFSGIGSWATGAKLAIWNWSGTTYWGTQVNNYANPSNLVFSNNSTLTSNLANISFYSDSGNSFVGSGFEVSGFSGGGSQIIAVPETETYFYAVVLLAGLAVQYIRRRAKIKSLGSNFYALPNRAFIQKKSGDEEFILEDFSGSISALQTAIDDARSDYPDTFLLIRLKPEGLYTVTSSPLVLGSKMCLTGNGTRIETSGSNIAAESLIK
jgi:autotransporter-associated beta strand protein